MIYIKTEEEIALIKESCLIIGKLFGELSKEIKPGVTPLYLDKISDTFIKDNGGQPAFKGYRGFPNTLCVSVNSAVVHGIPDNSPLKEGDIVSIDCGVLKNGYYGDSAYTFAVGEIAKDDLELLRVTKESLYIGAQQAIGGNRIGDIGHAIQIYAESFGYSVVRELVGHGIGRSLHEDPQVPNYGKKGQGVLLKEGMVLAIEPMINKGKKEVKTAKDGWTILTRDNSNSAHFEHTGVVRKDKFEILSTFEFLNK